MAEITNLKPWATSTVGESLFLFAYNLVASTLIRPEHELSWLNSSLGMNEFFRLTSTMEIVHRCLNTAVPLIKITPDISSVKIAGELQTTLQTRSINGSTLKLAELTRLSALAYVNRNLPEGLANSIHKTSKKLCCWCGKNTSRLKSSVDADKATVEHLWPEFLGGESIEANLIIACGACNSARQHAYNWAWFGVQACNEKLDSNKSLPRDIKLSVGLHRLMKVASGQTRYSNEIITLKDAAIRLQAVIPSISLVEDTRYTFLEILNNSKE
jgi:hypothetical protein